MTLQLLPSDFTGDYISNKRCAIGKAFLRKYGQGVLVGSDSVTVLDKTEQPVKTYRLDARDDLAIRREYLYDNPGPLVINLR